MIDCTPLAVYTQPAHWFVSVDLAVEGKVLEIQEE